jgi:hypothetical protein
MVENLALAAVKTSHTHSLQLSRSTYSPLVRNQEILPRNLWSHRRTGVASSLSLQKARNGLLVLFRNVGLLYGSIWQWIRGILKLILHIDFDYSVLR